MGPGMAGVTGGGGSGGVGGGGISRSLTLLLALQPAPSDGAPGGWGSGTGMATARTAFPLAAPRPLASCLLLPRPWTLLLRLLLQLGVSQVGAGKGGGRLWWVLGDMVRLWGGTVMMALGDNNVGWGLWGCGGTRMLP